jgi:hypothetical protein
MDRADGGFGRQNGLAGFEQHREAKTIGHR